MVTAAAPKMAEVEFITHRTDLKGNVSCGPVSPTLPVYVTWRPGTAEGSKVVVAIEFLPKGGTLHSWPGITLHSRSSK